MGFTIYLKNNEERSLRAGYGWVYANEVQRIEGKDKNGSLATVRAADGRFIGRGHINHLSKILVRIFIFNDRDDENDVIFSRLLYAAKMRKELDIGQAYRVVFAEADLLPGLIVDKFGDCLSVQFLTLGAELKKQFIVDCLVKIFSPRTIVERNDSPVREKEGLKQTKGFLYGKEDARTVITENSVKVNVDLLNGQKTGYFLDQKLNRLAIRRYVKNKTVLDCFSNVGGFALNAALGGAKNVVALDVSPLAVEEIQKNALLNGFDNVSAVCCDVFDKLREFKAEKRKFDVIVLDPPAFAKSSDAAPNALKGYKDLNVLAIKLLTEGGILVSSSCSHFVTQAMFTKMLAECAVETDKAVMVLEEKMQCVDHPYLLAAKETAYLKFYVLKVRSVNAELIGFEKE